MNQEQDENLLQTIPDYVREGNQINVKALLIVRQIRQADIAKKHKLASAEISKVVSGVRKTARIRRAIALELGMSVKALWPRF